MSDPYTSPRSGSAALILIDVQKDFYEDAAPARVEGTLEAVPAMVELTAAFRAQGRPIVHVMGAQATIYDQLGKIQGRTGNTTTNNAPRNVYKTKEGRWAAISTISTAASGTPDSSKRATSALASGPW